MGTMCQRAVRHVVSTKHLFSQGKSSILHKEPQGDLRKCQVPGNLAFPLYTDPQLPQLQDGLTYHEISLDTRIQDERRH